MSYALRPVTSLSEAWLLALEQAVDSPGGRMAHLMMTVTQPGAEIRCIRHGIDRELEQINEQSVDTVAETIFPQSLYSDPGFDWHPDLPSDQLHSMDHAAKDLYDSYVSILPLLLTVRANRMGTYFSRMISWPGKELGGTNQLSRVINRLRSVRRLNRATENTLDVDLSADCLGDATILEGAQTCAATDKRTRGFPCLVHLDFSLLNGALHCAAVYRHHYLITKAYGNFVGLSYLMQFLCQQTGFKIGELVVLAGLADSERTRRTRQLAVDMRCALDNVTAEDSR